MTMDVVRIGTRGSALALAQSGQVAALLVASGVCRDAPLTVIQTSGDRIQDRTLQEIGGKGLFLKEIEEALLDGSVDLAIHSMKDVPAELAPGLTLTATLPRESALDALITRGDAASSLEALPPNAVLGTCSLRRSSQALRVRPDLRIVALRGNVDTRIRKLSEGVDGLQAILLAQAGLRRLGLEVPAHPIPVTTMIPAIGQGALALETRTEDQPLREALHALDDASTASCTAAERALMAGLGGSCHVPIGGYAVLEEDGTIWLRGVVLGPEGETAVESEVRGDALDASQLGASLAVELLESGAEAILRSLGIEPPAAGGGHG
jgi:hydroxymethylbilane synthase